MATFLDHLKSALQANHFLGSGETPTPDEQTNGLAIGNRMLDAWNVERLMMFAIQRTTHTLIASTNPQTIGPSGANITTDRPVRIQKAGLIVAGQTTEYPIEVVFSVGEYARVRDKEIESGIPHLLYYEPALPLGKLYLAPVSNAANTLVLYRWTPFTSIATVGTTITFAPGYEKAFVSNLAVDLVAGGLGELTRTLEKQAEVSLDKLKNINLEVPILRNDAFGVGGRSGRRGGRADIRSNWP